MYDPQNGTSSPVSVKDEVVDNLAAGAGGGLPAHNYFDNPDFREKATALIAATWNAGAAISRSTCIRAMLTSISAAVERPLNT
ncbi:MAG TPA: hypothetical protein VN959_19500 [Mycobacterium sp.]|nr:hypothetical protein [Mycobacterium sp.]